MDKHGQKWKRASEAAKKAPDPHGRDQCGDVLFLPYENRNDLNRQS